MRVNKVVVQFSLPLLSLMDRPLIVLPVKLPERVYCDDFLGRPLLQASSAYSGPWSVIKIMVERRGLSPLLPPITADLEIR